jgi:hypothetical protein
MSGIMIFIIIVDLDESFGLKKKKETEKEKKALVLLYIYRHVAPSTGLQFMNKISKICISTHKCEPLNIKTS